MSIIILAIQFSRDLLLRLDIKMITNNVFSLLVTSFTHMIILAFLMSCPGFICK